ncbi:MAG: Apolipoprotein N-acyltransferase [Nitrospirae bacterium]|nr:MAG: apolipoprotein N-acyltransferase [Nitrospira sp. OLB3]MBV6471010.1 Apolipoprotein N-acyltransferase [Nitrospirota bacterium]MCE7965742.1 apolipoprotein N-acyltransferase [Nitrospira sp. NTP2]MCK6493135.1 apolipoprotein N-acyltransferase [Nitrospira sp.]MEB2339869.1 apolipoprotein N-acyltransferase [Nitrospirales bacterium]
MTISRARLILLACASGFLYPLSFPAFDLGALAWLALVPLHLAVEYVSPGRAFRLGWIAGTLAFTGSMFWVITAMNLYGKVPLPIAILVMLLLTVYLGLYLAIYAAGLCWIRSAFPTLGFLPAPFLWVSLELIRTYVLTGLPWVLFGYSQYQTLSIIQLADHFGVYGVSFLLVLVNAALAETILWSIKAYRGFQRHSFPWPSAAAAVAGVGMALFYGVTLLSAADQVPVRTLSVGVVQPNVEQAQKWDVAFRQETMGRFARLTADLGPDVDLIVWPEAATPFVFELEPQYRAIVSDMAQQADAPLLFGSPALRRYPDGRPFLLNSAYLLATEGQILGRYDKQHLVPFGEYIPFHNSLLFFLDKLVEGIGDFEAGPGPTLLMFKPREKVPPMAAAATAPDFHVKFGVVICYEVIFPNLVRQFAANGADFMVTVTNDAWFGPSSAPYQHFGMVVLRAVENRMAFARAANTGISGFIDPYGRVTQQSSIFTQTALKDTIMLSPQRTFYAQYGDLFAYGCVILTALLYLTGYFSQNTEPAGGSPAGRPA